MTNSITIKFKNHVEVECTGFSLIKQNNFDKLISSIFFNERDSKRFYTMTSVQQTEHDFIKLVSKNKSKNKNLIPTTQKIDDELFHKIFKFSIKPNSEKEISITPSWIKKSVLFQNSITTNFRITLIVDCDLLPKIQYELCCFENLQSNHNPYAPIAKKQLNFLLDSSIQIRETETYHLTPKVTKTSERQPLKAHNSATTFTPKVITPTQESEKKRKFKKHKAGADGIKRSTPSPDDVPVGANKDWFMNFSAAFNNPPPETKPPTINGLMKRLGHKSSLPNYILISDNEPELKKIKSEEKQEPVPTEAERVKSTIKDEYLRRILH